MSLPRTAVGTTGPDDEREYQAECDCGWLGDWVDSRIAADHQSTVHAKTHDYACTACRGTGRVAATRYTCRECGQLILESDVYQYASSQDDTATHYGPCPEPSNSITP